MKLTKNIKEIILVIILASIMAAVVCPECILAWYSLWRVEVIMLTIWFVMWYGNKYISHSIGQYVSWLENPTKRFAFGIIGSVVFSTSAIISLAILFEKLFNISIGEGWTYVWITIVVSLLILLFMLSRQFLYSWRDIYLREEKMRNEVLVSRYEVLKSQINPHFMFNGLNALSSLVHEDQDLAVKYIEQLSKVLRYVLQAGKQEIVTLQEEIEILNSYVFLQKIRYNDNLIVDISLDKTENNFYVAPLVLQMLIENAIKHNEITSENPLKIKLSLANQYLIMQNSVRIKEIALQESTHVGLTNIHSRYQALTDKKVVIEETDNNFIVSIPLISKT